MCTKETNEKNCMQCVCTLWEYTVWEDNITHPVDLNGGLHVGHDGDGYIHKLSISLREPQTWDFYYSVS